MSITTYAELKTAVANWLARADQTDRIPEFVALCEDRIAQDTRIRIRAMETSSDITINAQTEALPTGFLQLRRLYLNSDPIADLPFCAPGLFWTRYGVNESGSPEFFTIEGDDLVFAPTPTTAVTGKLLYYKRFTALSADNDTNWLLTNARGLYLYGTLLEAAIFRGDDADTLKFSTLYDDMADRLMRANQRDRFPRGAVVRSEVTTP
jgi:hypothetical protein